MPIGDMTNPKVLIRKTVKVVGMPMTHTAAQWLVIAGAIFGGIQWGLTEIKSAKADSSGAVQAVADVKSEVKEVRGEFQGVKTQNEWMASMIQSLLHKEGIPVPSRPADTAPKAGPIVITYTPDSAHGRTGIIRVGDTLYVPWLPDSSAVARDTTTPH